MKYALANGFDEVKKDILRPLSSINRKVIIIPNIKRQVAGRINAMHILLDL